MKNRGHVCRLAGFTFIELLVVVSIVAILVTLGGISYKNANQKAKDNIRKSDLTQYKTALESFANGNESYYPVGNSVKMSSFCSRYLTKFLSKCPEDPAFGSSANFVYGYQSDVPRENTSAEGAPVATKFVVWTGQANGKYQVNCSNGQSGEMPAAGFSVCNGECPLNNTPTCAFVPPSDQGQTVGCPAWSTYYNDVDRDGWGVSALSIRACSQPPGYVTNTGDCNDQDANTYPNQAQYFSSARDNGTFDYNCDGNITPDQQLWCINPQSSSYYSDNACSTSAGVCVNTLVVSSSLCGRSINPAITGYARIGNPALCRATTRWVQGSSVTVKCR